MNLSDIAKVLHLPYTRDCLLTGFSTDSRKIKPGELFIAFQGERVDGHDFIADVAKAGGQAVLCERLIADVHIEQLVVPSTLEALAILAQHYRQQVSCPVIAVTGSNGKTSVKEMIAKIFPQPSFATQGNLNTQIGVPMSLMQLQPQHRYAVFELGARHQGDITYTVSMVKPQVAVIKNIAPAHIEIFGSLDGVATAKGEIYQGVCAGGTVVINDDDAYAHFWDDQIKDCQVLRFSRHHVADVYAKDVKLSPHGQAEFTLVVGNDAAPVRLKVPGMHHVSNALAAAACTDAVGISLAEIVAGLESFTGVPGRTTFRNGKNQATIIDDTYNANLRSTLAAVEVLAKCEGVKILVLGDMGELGEWAVRHHEEVGIAARDQGIDRVLTCGKLSAKTALAFGTGGQHYATQDELAKDLLPRLDAQTTVLVKGSRMAAMENIVQQLI